MLAAAVFLLRSEWEKLQIRSEHYEAETGKLPEGGTLRVVFFSDLHHYLPAVHDQQKIIHEIEKADPAAVLIGGDLLSVRKQGGSPVETGSVLSLLEKIAQKYPVYYGDGNHEVRFRERRPGEYAEYVEKLLSSGIRYLPDGVLDLCEGVKIFSCSLEKEYYQKLSPGFSKKTPMKEGYFFEKSGLSDSESYNILLVHSPMYLKEAAAAGADLVLSGHMHGGTVRLPGGAGLMTPQFQFFVKECSGEHTLGKTKMIVNRGLGTHSIRIRLNDLPEISVIDIKGK